MTIEQIDTSKVLILLGNNDMKDFSLEYSTLSFKDPHSRRILSRLLTLACSKTGISIDNKKMFVEALPHKNGCLILLTLKPKTARRIFRIKKREKCLCCIFENVDSLIDAAVAVSQSIGKNEIYFRGSRYYLITEENVAAANLSRLEEFCECCMCSKISAAKVREAGKYIGELTEIGKHFKIKK